MNKRVLAIAAHPDDEALGCAGTLARHAQTGDTVHILFLADGETARSEVADIKKRNTAAHAAAEVMRAKPPILLGLPDNRLDSLPLLDIVQHVENHIENINPEIIYTHHGGDLNIDHRVTHQAVLTACRPMPGSKVAAIYGFETLSSTEWASPETSPGFKPTRFVDVSKQLDIKIAALRCYDDEIRPFPHSRSYEAAKHQALLRGASVGMDAAEAFSVVRELVR